MQLYLYSCADPEYFANKTFTTLWSGNVEPYGTPSTNGASFIVSDTLYEANYARYDFGSYHIYGTVDISCGADGLYQYDISVDPLTTAWYAGAMNSTQYVVRETAGNPLLYDPELTYDPLTDVTEILIDDTTPNMRYLVTVVGPYGNAFPDVPSLSSRIQNPAIRTYMLTGGAMFAFYNALLSKDDAEQARFAPSIVRVCAVDAHDIPTYMTTYPATKITLYAVNQSDDLFGTAPTHIDHLDIPLLQGVGTAFIIPPSALRSQVSVSSTANISITVSGENINDEFILNIRDMGQIRFSLGNLGLSTITKIGYQKTIDYSGGQAIAFLRVNDTIFHNYRLSAAIPELTPMLYDSSVVNWLSIGAQTAAAGISLGIGAMTGGVGLAMAATTLSGEGANLVGQVQSAMNGTSSMTGIVGSSLDRASGMPSQIIRLHREPLNKAAYHIVFGMPSETTRNLSTRSGYIRTRDCHLGGNLPRDILTQAERSCNSGIRIK